MKQPCIETVPLMFLLYKNELQMTADILLKTILSNLSFAA